MTEGRPYPPARFTSFPLVDRFEPAPDLGRWVRETFLQPGGALFNQDHAILGTGKARIGWLWTNVPNERHGRRIIGMAETPFYQGGRWAKHRQQVQMREWFGAWWPLEPEPEFIITLDAVWASTAADASWCALVEHELYHCAQALDKDGMPAYSEATGRPKWRIRGHDVEEFTGVVARYGPDAVGARAFVKAAVEADFGRPGLAGIQSACGTSAAA